MKTWLMRSYGLRDQQAPLFALGKAFGQAPPTQLGIRPRVHLTADRIKKCIRSRQREGAANASINRELSALKRMFKLAVESAGFASLHTSRCWKKTMPARASSIIVFS